MYNLHLIMKDTRQAQTEQHKQNKPREACTGFWRVQGCEERSRSQVTEDVNSVISRGWKTLFFSNEGHHWNNRWNLNKAQRLDNSL